MAGMTDNQSGTENLVAGAPAAGLTQGRR